MLRRLVPAIRTEPDTTRGFSPDIPAGAERLAELLGAHINGNEFGQHLVLRRWFSDPIADGPTYPE